MSPPTPGSGSRDGANLPAAGGAPSAPHLDLATRRQRPGVQRGGAHLPGGVGGAPPHSTITFLGGWVGKILFAFVVPLLAACSNGDGGPAAPTATPAVVAVDGSITVRAGEWYFEPSSLRVQEAREITIVLKNEGGILHNLKLEDLDGELIESRSSGPQEADAGELFVGADSRKEGTLVFRPLEQGSFTYYCTLEGHRAFGMEGTLIVEAAP